MFAGLPQTVDPYRLAEAGERYAGRVEQSVFKRLGSMAHPAGRQFKLSLRFGVEQGIPCLRGRLAGDIAVTCQRCMEPMDLTIDTRFLFGFARNQEEELRLPDGFEPLRIEQRELALFPVVEDELLLALPMVALHPQSVCPAEADTAVMDEQAERGRTSPFSVLAALKQNKQ